MASKCCWPVDVDTLLSVRRGHERVNASCDSLQRHGARDVCPYADSRVTWILCKCGSAASRRKTEPGPEDHSSCASGGPTRRHPPSTPCLHFRSPRRGSMTEVHACARHPIARAIVGPRYQYTHRRVVSVRISERTGGRHPEKLCHAMLSLLRISSGRIRTTGLVQGRRTGGADRACSTGETRTRA